MNLKKIKNEFNSKNIFANSLKQIIKKFKL